MIGIWPPSKLRLRPSAFAPGVEMLERRAQEAFHAKNAVIFSSARAALVAILRTWGVRREDSVWIPPYSSHCVINSVGYVGSPQSLSTSSSEFGLLFHQWGYPVVFGASWKKVVEDSVDSFPAAEVGEPGYFPNHGDYELFSLPKLLGNQFGGVALCASEELASRLRDTRSRMTRFGSAHPFLRVFGGRFSRLYSYWNASEPLNGGLPAWVRGEMLSGLDWWGRVQSERLERLKLVRESGDFPGLQSGGRLPCVLKLDPAFFPLLSEGGHPVYLRNEYRLEGGEVSVSKTCLLPIHQSVELPVLRQALRAIAGLRGSVGA